jgi:hypothetical protein
MVRNKQSIIIFSAVISLGLFFSLEIAFASCSTNTGSGYCPKVGQQCELCTPTGGCQVIGGWWCVNCGAGPTCVSCGSSGGDECQIICVGPNPQCVPKPSSRPCGNCIPSGCGFTALPLEKKFVIGNKTSDEIQQFFLRSAQFSRSTMTAENDLSRATSVVRKENSSVVSDRKTFLASIFEPSLKTIRNFLSRIFFYRS